MSRYKNYEHCSVPKQDITTTSRLIAGSSSERELNHTSAFAISPTNDEDITSTSRLIAGSSSERELNHTSSSAISPTNGVQMSNGPNSRLEYIINAMSYIRGELVSVW